MQIMNKGLFKDPDIWTRMFNILENTSNYFVHMVLYVFSSIIKTELHKYMHTQPNYRSDLRQNSRKDSMSGDLLSNPRNWSINLFVQQKYKQTFFLQVWDKIEKNHKMLKQNTSCIEAKTSLLQSCGHIHFVPFHFCFVKNFP